MKRLFVAVAFLLTLVPIGAGAEQHWVSGEEAGLKYNAGIMCDSNEYWITVAGSAETDTRFSYHEQQAGYWSSHIYVAGETGATFVGPRGSGGELGVVVVHPAGKAGYEGGGLQLGSTCGEPVMPGTAPAVPTQMPVETPTPVETPVAPVETPAPVAPSPTPGDATELAALVIEMPDGGSIEGSPYELYAPMAAQFAATPYLTGVVGAGNTIAVPELPAGQYRLVIYSDAYGTIDAIVTLGEPLAEGEVLVINITAAQVERMPAAPVAPGSGSAPGSVTGTAGVSGLPKTGAGGPGTSEIFSTLMLAHLAVIAFAGVLLRRNHR